MLRIKNTSIQSFDLFFMTEAGTKTYWLTPGNTLVVPESYITDQVRLLEKRRILKITRSN